MSLFSVIIPTYNREKVIMRTIQSVLHQNLKDFELIVVDDGSTDRTIDILCPLMKMQNFTYLYQKNQGAQVARNYGLQHASGQYVVFLDSDDTWLPSFLEEVYMEYQKKTDIGCVYCLTGKLDDTGTVVCARQDTLTGTIYAEALRQGYITSPSFLVIKRSCFEKIGVWDIQLKSSQDDDICFRLAKEYKYSLIPKVLGVYYSDYEGNSNRIGASLSRVAYGWWVLWNKYEKDVIQYCGIHVMLAHYLECVQGFHTAKDFLMMQLAFKKVKQLGENDIGKDICDLLQHLSTDELYCYGAGKYGEVTSKFLLKNGHRVIALVISDNQVKPTKRMHLPVIYNRELPKTKCTVLLATQPKYQQEIYCTLKGCANLSIYAISESTFYWMRASLWCEQNNMERRS